MTKLPTADDHADPMKAHLAHTEQGIAPGQGISRVRADNVHPVNDPAQSAFVQAMLAHREKFREITKERGLLLQRVKDLGVTPELLAQQKGNLTIEQQQVQADLQRSSAMLQGLAVEIVAAFREDAKRTVLLGN